jgi:hypothetical protein
MGGLIVLEDDGTFTADNGGNVWDLEGSRIVLVPQGGGFYDATRDAATLDGNLGTLEATWNGVWGQHQITLPVFAFPFGDSETNDLHVTSDLGIFLTSQSPNSSGFQYSQADIEASDEPRITSLLRDSPWIWADILDLWVRIDSDRVVITWHEKSSRPESQPHLDRMFQVTLFSSGRIELSYPDALSFNTFGAVQVVSPGPAGSSLTDLSTLGSSPVTVRHLREAFTVPTILPFSVESFVQGEYGLDDTNYDALAIYQNHYTEITSYAGAYHTNGRPGATGIGNDGLRQTSLLHMNHIDLSWNHRDDGSKVSVLSHELGHRWLFFINGVGLSRSGGHPAQNAHLPAPFPWFTGVDSSCMGGTTWTDNGNGTFTSPPEQTYYAYAWLELYLMGLAPPSEVLPWWWIDGSPSLNGPYYPPLDSTYSGTRVDLTIDDVVTANGARMPAYPDSQDAFRVAFVLLTRPENPATDADLTNVREKMRLWQARWEESVNGRASVDTELTEIVGTGALDCNFNGISDALDISSGTSADCNANTIPDECEMFPTITLLPQTTTVSPGGSIFYDIEVSNPTAGTHLIDLWVEAERPGGVPYSGNPILGPRTINLTPGRMITRTVRLRVPAGTPAPSGPFTIRALLGSHPSCDVARSEFQFTVE